MMEGTPNILIEGMEVNKDRPLYLIISPSGRVTGVLDTVVPHPCHASTVRECSKSSKLNWPEWISVEERKAEFPCLCYDANGNPPFIPKGILTITDAQGTWQIDAHLADSALHQGKAKPVLGYGNRITHWMPLPDAPKEATP